MEIPYRDHDGQSVRVRTAYEPHLPTVEDRTGEHFEAGLTMYAYSAAVAVPTFSRIRVSDLPSECAFREDEPDANNRCATLLRYSFPAPIHS